MFRFRRHTLIESAGCSKMNQHSISVEVCIVCCDNDCLQAAALTLSYWDEN